jgi:hypothetical protein
MSLVTLRLKALADKKCSGVIYWGYFPLFHMRRFRCINEYFRDMFLSTQLDRK